eukprot:Nk52_evm58s78 gene=Nk52_evmTU58s78
MIWTNLHGRRASGRAVVLLSIAFVFVVQLALAAPLMSTGEFHGTEGVISERGLLKRDYDFDTYSKTRFIDLTTNFEWFFNSQLAELDGFAKFLISFLRTIFKRASSFWYY